MQKILTSEPAGSSLELALSSSAGGQVKGRINETGDRSQESGERSKAQGTRLKVKGEREKAPQNKCLTQRPQGPQRQSAAEGAAYGTA
jgi:hypothetical protein